MIKVDESEPIGELEAKFPYRDVQIKRGVDVKEYYDLEAEIGRGKFGTVYLCREKATSLTLAAKFVGIQRRQDRKNVEREVEIMRTLQHPRLIQLYDAFESDSTMVVVLELIEGGELFERVIGDDFILTEKACTIFMRQICEGVAFIHKNNIIHLDLKPENILCLTKAGNRIKIIDFGLARHYEPGSKLQVLFGTPEFVAPEVVNFDQISPATDMWSVGVICYVLLSGLSPFMGDTDVETMTNVTLGRYDFDDESFESISQNAKDFISSLLVNNKEKRLTADLCVQHPWLRRKIPPPPPELQTTKENLKAFVENYNSVNGITENIADQIINTKPSALNAVELITASDKEFLNPEKSFSNISYESRMSPVRFPVVTNNNTVPVLNDDIKPVNDVSNTNVEVMNMMNANISSMHSPQTLDNLLSVEPIMPNDESNASNSKPLVQIKDNHIESDLAASSPALNIPSARARAASETEPSKMLSPTNVTATEMPIAHLSFISKSLPAAAAMLDESMMSQWKPLNISSIPPLPSELVVDDPITAHPPIVGTTLPPKRVAIDIDMLLPKRRPDGSPVEPRSPDTVPSPTPGIVNVDILDKYGLAEAVPFKSERFSPIRDKPQESVQLPPQLDFSKLVTPNAEVQQVNQATTPPLHPPSISLSNESKPAQYEEAADTREPLTTVPSTTSPVPASSPFPFDISCHGDISSPITLPNQRTSSPQSPNEILVHQSKPEDAPSSSSPVTSPIRTSPPNMITTQNISSLSLLTAAKETGKTMPNPLPTSPLTAPTNNPPKRESPLQKTLDEIPKLSSEILSSLTNMPSLSNLCNFDVSTRKTNKVTTKTSTFTESSRYTSHKAPAQAVNVTEHSSYSFSSSTPHKPGSQLKGSTMGRTESIDKSIFSNVSSAGSSSYIKRTERKEQSNLRQSIFSEVSTTSEEKTKSESDAILFKQKLRSTTPWFSERKHPSSQNIEKRSSDITNMLTENLGPLEKSPWAREIRQISAKLVEMSKDTSARKEEDEVRIMELQKQQTARRQKFKVSILNRDVVFGAAREFYLGGEVPKGSPPLQQQMRGHRSQEAKRAQQASHSSRTSPDRTTKPGLKSTAK